jgi:hypothetical protein
VGAKIKIRPEAATGLPIFGDDEIVRDGAGGRRVNCMRIKTGENAENVGFVLEFYYILITEGFADLSTIYTASILEIWTIPY